MTDEKPAVIQRFHLWAYTRSILGDDEEIETARWVDLFRLWLFAEKYGLPDLQNAAVDHLAAKNTVLRELPTGYLHLIYDNTSAASPLRRFITALSAQHGNLEEWFSLESLEDKPADHWPPLF